MIEERKHSIDKLFHESLDGHKMEPSKGVWASLSSHVPAKSGRGMLIFFTAAIVLIGSVSLFLFFNNSTEDQVADSNIITQDNAPLNSSETPNTTQNITSTENTDTQQNIDQNNTQSSLPEENISPPAEKPSKNSTTTPEEIVPLERSMSGQEAPEAERYRLEMLDYRIAMIEYNDHIDLHMEEARDVPKPVYGLSMKDAYVKKADILFGAAFSPAVNIYPDGQNRNDYSFEVVAAYEKSRFLAESGIGANYTTESAEYGITYSTYDSVGYFINVNSFTVDPANSDSVRFETSVKSIYDSIERYRVEENTNKYAYLQIPIRVGYRVIQKDRFSIDLKAGILFSLQVYKEVPEIPYQGSDGEQIEVIRQYPNRLKTNWQYTTGIGLNFHLSRNSRLTIEPFYRQYIKSVYSTSSEYSARSPYAFGIRGGIYIQF